MYITPILIWMTFSICAPSPLGNREDDTAELTVQSSESNLTANSVNNNDTPLSVRNNSSNGSFETRSNSTSVKEKNQFDFPTEIFQNTSTDTDLESDFHSGNLTLNTIESQLKPTRIGVDYISENNEQTSNNTSGETIFHAFRPYGIMGTNQTGIRKRFNLSSPDDVINRQNVGSNWLTINGNSAFGQPFVGSVFPYGTGLNNGYGTGYIYPPVAGMPVGGAWPGNVGNGYLQGSGYGSYAGSGYESYPYGGINNAYGYGGIPGISYGYDFINGYGNWYGNAYPPGYEYWSNYGVNRDPWFWQKFPKGYWNSQESWG